jgi:hypothetical protein
LLICFLVFPFFFAFFAFFFKFLKNKNKLWFGEHNPSGCFGKPWLIG